MYGNGRLFAKLKKLEQNELYKNCNVLSSLYTEKNYCKNQIFLSVDRLRKT